jgi:hypothetical protein
MTDTLKIVHVVEETSSLGEVFPGYTFEMKTDVSDVTVHEWFKIFEKVLAASGFSDRVIMKGACELAFNSMRDRKDMVWLHEEYDLGEFGKLPGEE